MNTVSNSFSIPRILTLNGDQIVAVMIEHNLGLMSSPRNADRLDIDPDYFVAFEAMKGFLSHHVAEDRQNYIVDSSVPDSNPLADEQTIDLRPEEDLISLNALGYALRVDPTRVRRWVENEKLSVSRCFPSIRRAHKLLFQTGSD